MSGNDSEAEASEQPRSFMALPGRTEDGTAVFHRCLSDLLELAGAEVAPETSDPHEWRIAARGMLRRNLRGRDQLPEEFFDALIRAAVHDPDPSFNRQFVEPALAAFGGRRVLTALLDRLRNGTNQDRAGAARAWYWGMGLTWSKLKGSGPEHQADRDAVKDLQAQWDEAALREFVSNEDLDVRRCLLPGLPLKPARYPADLHELVAEAIHIARTHPDEYLRHRVEIQV